MKYSLHADLRCNQRGILSKTVELILDHGVPRNLKGAVTEYLISNKLANSKIAYHKSKIHQYEKAAGKVVIVNTDKNIVITTYNNK